MAVPPESTGLFVNVAMLDAIEIVGVTVLPAINSNAPVPVTIRPYSLPPDCKIKFGLELRLRLVPLKVRFALSVSKPLVVA